MSRAPRLVLALLAALAFALTAPQALAQAARAAPAPAPAPAPALVEEEAPDSPRASVRSFFDLAERGRYEEAARYLDVPRGAEKRSAELARKLRIVLGERLWVDPETLSARSEGRDEGNVPRGVEELGKIKDARGRVVSVRLVRHEARSPEDEPRWVFAQSTVQNVDALYAALRGRWIREHLPAPLLEPGPKSLYVWQWLAFPVLALVCIAFGRLLTWMTGLVVGRLTRRISWSARLLERLKKPVTLAYGVTCFALLLPYLALTLRAEDLLERLLAALGWLAFFWALLRAVAVAGDEVAAAEWAAPRPGVRSITSVGVKLGKLVVGALALMVALSELGYPVTSVVAGLGIGGVALALAAQKTVENLFGSLSILGDQPFQVGDLIRVDGVEGTVESIGLRSTRLRTIDRTLVIIPNGKLADMRIESLGARDRIRFYTKLSISRDTGGEQVRALVEAVAAKLQAHPAVHAEDVYVRLAGLGESSFDIDVAAPVETTDFREFARVREELLLELLTLVDAAGARLAIPTRQLVPPPAPEAARSHGASAA